MILIFRTLIVSFNKHDVHVISDRLLTNYIGQIESFPLIRKVWFDLPGGLPSEIIDWYEKGWDKERTARYENINDNLVNFFERIISCIDGRYDNSCSGTFFIPSFLL